MSSFRTIEEHAKEKFSLPSGWTAWKWECFPHGSPLYTELVGAVCPPRKSGKNKGRPNFRKPVPGTKATVIITVAEHEAWLLEWEGKTGKCHECQGTGQAFAGWSAAEGTRTRPCRRCNATGKNPATL